MLCVCHALKMRESDRFGVQAFNIKCNVTSEINHMNEGIRLGLQEDREKHSESLGRTAQWHGTAALATLPAYLTIQIMRFFYKVATQQRAKIMRRVSFTHQLDMFEFCSKDLQAKLRAPRKAYDEIADAKAGIKKDKAPLAGDAAGGVCMSAMRTSNVILASCSWL